MHAPNGQWSLRRRLMLIAFATSAAAAMAGGGVMYWAAAHEDGVLFDARLIEVAHIVESFAEHEIVEMEDQGRTDIVRGQSAFNVGSRYQYQVWSQGGQLLMHSANAPHAAPLVPLTTNGFATWRDGVEVRAYAMPAARNLMQIQVAERIRPDDRVVARFGSAFFALLLTALSVVGAMGWWCLRFTLRSIDNTADQLSHQNPGQLTPVHERNPPAELIPMIAAVNQLLIRMESSMSAQRRFTAVAAHEMRTPLAGLRAHAQVARRARSPSERATALDAVMHGVDRTTHLLSQLLDLAHVESLVGDGSAVHQYAETVQFADLYRVVIADLETARDRLRPELVCRFDAPSVQGEPFGLSVLMRNLLRNAIAYTPAAGSIEVHSAVIDGALTLTIDDSGPGIPQHERERVFERFYRMRGQQVDGVGLGLSIVHSVAAMHRATVHLNDSPLGGLRVEIRFAASPAPSSFGLNLPTSAARPGDLLASRAAG